MSIEKYNAKLPVAARLANALSKTDRLCQKKWVTGGGANYRRGGYRPDTSGAEIEKRCSRQYGDASRLTHGDMNERFSL